MPVDLSYLNEDSTHAAQGADAYPAVPNSNPWGAGGVPDGAVTPFAEAAGLNGFYDDRDNLVGGTDTHYNMIGGEDQAGGNWASYGDSAPVFNASSGLGGERTKFSGTLGQESLSGGDNPDTPYGH